VFVSAKIKRRDWRLKRVAVLDQRFELCDELLSHLRAFFDLFAGFLPVCAASAVAGLFADVFVDDFVNFAFVFVCDLYFSFFQNSVKPFPATQIFHRLMVVTGVI
jgi:hypothetical protein